MAQDIEIANAQYNDVPSIEVPLQGGGTASFVDTTDADAIASEIDMGKTAYVNGVKLTGTRSGGGGGSYTAGDGIDITNDVISLETASANDIGGIKVGDGLSIDANGVLSVDGGSGLTVTNLFTSASGKSSGDITLTDNWNNYDFISFTVWNGSGSKNQCTYSKAFLEEVKTNSRLFIAIRYTDSQVTLNINSYGAFNIYGVGNNGKIYSVDGYKFGGGSSLSSQIASLEARIQALESQLS